MLLRCKNKGEIELNALKLLGACSKRNDGSKIGFFGTGLKYAMSVLLREGITFKIFTGEREIKIGTIDEGFRGQTFKVITIDGERTSLTTDTGIKWDVWQAVREIVCNALDEDGVNQLVKEVAPVVGETHIYVDATMAKVKEVTDNWNKYFAQDREEIHKCEYGRILEANDSEANIYKKGIRAYNSSYVSLYDYDLFCGNLGEDRVLSYSDVIYYVSKLYNDAPKEVILKYASIWKKAFGNEFERAIEGQGISPGRNWVTALKGKQVLAYDFAGMFPDIVAQSNSVLLPSRLVDRLIELYEGEIEFVTGKCNIYHKYVQVQGSERQREMLNQGLTFLQKCNLYNGETITIGSFTKNVKAPVLSNNDGIVIPTTLFNLGTKMLTAHILRTLTIAKEADTITTEYLSLLEEKHNTYL